MICLLHLTIQNACYIQATQLFTQVTTNAWPHSKVHPSLQSKQKLEHRHLVQKQPLTNKPQKTTFMLLHSSLINTMSCPTLDNHVLSISEAYKFLGIILDKHLISSSCSILDAESFVRHPNHHQNSCVFPTSHCTILISCIPTVTSHTVCRVWGNTYFTHIKRLQWFQNQANRLMSSSSFNCTLCPHIKH